MVVWIDEYIVRTVWVDERYLKFLWSKVIVDVWTWEYQNDSTIAIFYNI